jgi:hypothetical protein
MIPTDVVACVDDLVTRVISDAAGDYPGVHTRKQVIGNKMAFTEDVMTLMNAELTVAQNEMVECQAKIAELERQVARWRGYVTVPTIADCWRRFSTQDDMDCWYRGMPAYTTVIRFIGVVARTGFLNGHWQTEAYTSGMTGEPYYAFEFPWKRDPGSDSATFDGTDRVIEHFATHQLHMLTKLEPGESVVMTDNPGAWDHMWSLVSDNIRDDGDDDY